MSDQPSHEDYRTVAEAWLGDSVVMMGEPVSFPHGERYGGVKDPCGNIWWPAMRVK